jgi:hypothetical protein
MKCVLFWLFFSMYFCPLITNPSSIVGFSLPIASISSTLQSREANALLKWKASLDNQSQALLSSWSGNNSCSWLGTTCDEDSMSVYKVNLTYMGLKGTLESLNFSLLPNILSLDLKGNFFDGNIPSHIKMLSKLSHLDLSQNNISGTIPYEIMTHLTSLQILSLSYNVLNGAINGELVVLVTLVSSRQQTFR